MNSSSVNAASNGSHTDEGGLHLGELAGVVIMNKTAEYFSIFVFAIAAALAFPQVFFPNYEPVVGMLMSFAVFSLAFIARAFSRFIFRVLDRRIGRAAKITVAMFVFGGSTMCIGFVPGYADIGVIAVILLCLARIGQGLGVGGTWDGLAIVMMLNSPKNKESWYSMMPQIGAPVGFFMAASIFYVLTEYLTPEEFYSYGWRFPFFVVLATQVVALFARLRLIDTPEYKNMVDHHELQSSPVNEVIRHHWKQLILGIYLPLTAYALFHLMTIYPLGYVMLYGKTSIPDMLLMQLVGGILAMITCVLSGILGDSFGRRKILFIVTAFVGVLSFNMTTLVSNPWFYVLSGFVLLGFSLGQAAGTLPHRFKTKYRYTGMSLTTDVTWLFGAAFAPIIAMSLTHMFGIEYAGYYLLSGVVATLLALYIVDRMVKAGTEEH